MESAKLLWSALTSRSPLRVTDESIALTERGQLAGAIGTAVAITWWTRGLLPYVAAVAWALGGVIVSTVQEGYPAIATTAGLCLAIVLPTAVLARRQARP